MITIEQPHTPSEDRLHNPSYALHIGDAFARRFGVDVDPFNSGPEYEAQMRGVNPRTAKGLVRYELEDSKADWSEADSRLIMHTASQLGILAPEYAFEGEEADVLIVAEGARTATFDRGVFALEAIKRGLLGLGKDIWVIGSDRIVGDKEKDALAGIAPDAQTGFDVADAVAGHLNSIYGDTIDNAGVRLRAFHVETPKPDHRKVVAELIDRRRKEGDRISRLAVATTALYVPFKTHKGLAVAKPRDVEVVTRGVSSDPKIVDARTVDTYMSEVATTLTSAAQHKQVA